MNAAGDGEKLGVMMVTLTLGGQQDESKDPQLARHEGQQDSCPGGLDAQKTKRP